MKTNVIYVSKDFNVNPTKKAVNCKLQFAINLDKMPNIGAFSMIPEFDDYMDNLVKYGYARVVSEIEAVDGEVMSSEFGFVLFTVRGNAKCAEDDVFDETLGRKLALTRAQRQAFHEAGDFYDDLTCIVENAFQNVYTYMFNSMESEYSCKCHEHELTGHEMVDYDSETED